MKVRTLDLHSKNKKNAYNQQLLENFDNKLDLHEVVSLAADKSQAIVTRYLAYLYLVAQSDLHTFTKISKMGFDPARKINGKCALLVAAATGNTEVFKLLAPSGALITERMKGKLLLEAIANGRIDMLQLLVAPTKQKGYGFSLDFKDICPSKWGHLFSVNFGNTELEFVAGGNEDAIGYRLISGDYRSIQVAVTNDQVAMLELLIKPKRSGGYDLPIVDVSSLLNKSPSKEMRNCIFKHYFEQLISKNSSPTKALAWAKSERVAPYLTEGVKNFLYERACKLLKFHHSLKPEFGTFFLYMNRSNSIKEIVTFLDFLKPGSGRSELAKLTEPYRVNNDFYGTAKQFNGILDLEASVDVQSLSVEENSGSYKPQM
jgi:hypothetical protein